MCVTRKLGTFFGHGLIGFEAQLREPNARVRPSGAGTHTGHTGHTVGLAELTDEPQVEPHNQPNPHQRTRHRTTARRLFRQT